jgi:hypothetical protein
MYDADYNLRKKLSGKKKKIIRDINDKINRQTKDIFKHIKISDTLNSFKTQVYKTINIKKEREHQGSRKNKIEEIANFVEAIKANQTNYIALKIEDDYFKDIIKVCNEYYLDLFKNDFSYYFAKQIKEVSLNKDSFLLNVGRFGGAELKSIEEIRSLPITGADVDWETTARTYALEKHLSNEVFFENKLLPFGWIL